MIKTTLLPVAVGNCYMFISAQLVDSCLYSKNSVSSKSSFSHVKSQHNVLERRENYEQQNLPAQKRDETRTL